MRAITLSLIAPTSSIVQARVFWFYVIVTVQTKALSGLFPRGRLTFTKPLLTEGKIMRDEYDFSKATKNPYASQLKKQITIRLDGESINYFKSISEGIGIPYQSLINLPD